MKAAFYLALASFLGFAVSCFSPVEDENGISYRSHVELGDVHWLRDFEKAKRSSKSSDKPMFVLFQEIPGCQTCQNFGKQPLSHPLVVEAIEDLFVPVTVFNNKGGTDQQILKRFNEPSWNNPVVRFMNSDESDIIRRKDRVWTTQGISDRMIGALKKSGKTVPDYLRTIALPTNKKVETAEFAMHCYWEGEVRLGGIEGVYTTRSGWRNNLEVVQVRFSPDLVSYKELLTRARQLKCATKVFTHNARQLEIATQMVGSDAIPVSGKMRDAKPSDQKYYLTKTDWRHLPLTAIQATKLNALAKNRQSTEEILSPRQRSLLKQIAQTNKLNPTALKQFQFPDNEEQLSDYRARLVRTLNSSNP